MKLAISGKGGVGKTTFAALLCRLLADRGKRVLAIDADPDANLAVAIGISRDEAGGTKPINSMPELIEERTGVRPGSGDTFFKLNPHVDDIPERYSIEFQGIKVLILGKYKQGGAGCSTSLLLVPSSCSPALSAGRFLLPGLRKRGSRVLSPCRKYTARVRIYPAMVR